MIESLRVGSCAQHRVASESPDPLEHGGGMDIAPSKRGAVRGGLKPGRQVNHG